MEVSGARRLTTASRHRACVSLILLLALNVSMSITTDVETVDDQVTQPTMTSSPGQSMNQELVSMSPIYYTDQWAVQVDGTEEDARKLGERHGFVYVDKVMDNYYLFKHRRVSKRSVQPSNHYDDELSEEPKVKWLQQQFVKKRVKRADQRLFNDPKWPRMWYLNRGIGLDMNVVPAWQRGYTGKDVVVTILDDGIEKDHPDLKTNYDPLASYDVNEHDHDPQPRYDYTNENRHGTRCAGVVAAESNNSICSTGIAYNARIGGVRMLDGEVTDAVEAQSLSLNPQHIDIYSASWGPDDDGRTVDGPGPLAWKAFINGITKGRGGRGSIFVWASGNGGNNGDNCNCDGYTNSIYTLSISSATENGQVPWYSEACPSSLATTYSSGSGIDRQIVTTDLRKGCTEMHTGTSASAPLAAGIFALVLQANNQLTWRDLQHIVVMTARKANLIANDWTTNAVGRQVSHHFGYGLLDVDAMVQLAENWTTVPEQHRCEITAKIQPRGITITGKSEVPLHSHGCIGTPNAVRYVEHVQAVLTLTASRRGDVEIALTSPGGTRSTLLASRPGDHKADGFTGWAFMTTHSWGENPVGVWKLEVRTRHGPFTQVRLSRWSLVLFGTERNPYPDAIAATNLKSTGVAAVSTVEPVRHNHDLPAVAMATVESSLRNRVILKNWSLVFYGTATHPTAYRDQHLKQPHQCVSSAAASTLLMSSGRPYTSAFVTSIVILVTSASIFRSIYNSAVYGNRSTFKSLYCGCVT